MPRASDAPAHDSPYDDTLAVAVDAAREGAAIIRDYAGQIDGMRSKGRNDFVTVADEAAQAAILETLRDAFPDDAILAEEGDASDGGRASVEGRQWIVDPIDGTTNFIQQVPPYAVSIACRDGDRIVVGVVLDVPHDELFTAVAGHGVRVDGRAIDPPGAGDLADAFVATGFPYRRFEHTEVYLDVLSDVLPATRGVRRHGAASVDLARLAAGRFDVFFETGLRPWDVAAGTLLVREAGGRVTDYRGARGLTPVFDRQVCASLGAIHDDVLALLRPMIDVRL